jgi:hypothetical protein
VSRFQLIAIRQLRVSTYPCLLAAVLLKAVLKLTSSRQEVAALRIAMISISVST